MRSFGGGQLELLKNLDDRRTRRRARPARPVQQPMVRWRSSHSARVDIDAHLAPPCSTCLTLEPQDLWLFDPHCADWMPAVWR